MATIDTTNWDETSYHRVGPTVVYFVKNGYMNGVEGVNALTSGFGKQVKDGWYYLVDGQEDGVGPFTTEDAVIEAAQESSHYGF